MSIKKPIVSIIVPIYNGANWIEKCFNGILLQTAVDIVDLEVCVCDDASVDDTINLCEFWSKIFNEHNIIFKIFRNSTGKPKGVGFSKNRAVEISSGQYLCFQDIDDVMLPERISKQYNLACNETINSLIGCKFKRIPENSTVRYTKWANSLNEKQLNIQIYTSHGPTIIMPTWFCSRIAYDNVGGFVEGEKGTPEDLIFFYKHLDAGGKIFRVDENLLDYTYHPKNTTFSIHEDTIWKLRIDRLEKVILPTWSKFTIWNAGKQGRKLYNSLSLVNKQKVAAFCDVDINKIGKTYEHYDSNTRTTEAPINIIHFRDATPPFIICIKIDLTDGVFENNLKSLNLEEGTDYILFS